MKSNLISILTIIALVQLVAVTTTIELISVFKPEELQYILFSPYQVFAGNLQIILIIIFYKLFAKYIRIS